MPLRQVNTIFADIAEPVPEPEPSGGIPVIKYSDFNFLNGYYWKNNYYAKYLGNEYVKLDKGQSYTFTYGRSRIRHSTNYRYNIDFIEIYKISENNYSIKKIVLPYATSSYGNTTYTYKNNYFTEVILIRFLFTDSQPVTPYISVGSSDEAQFNLKVNGVFCINNNIIYSNYNTDIIYPNTNQIYLTCDLVDDINHQN